ncbi:hypothetical protein OsccyDRAFT_3128 [Leptolyngbyaceae cyanobacterium JSC-12]|nr:hypothetical protein OsccyDRAFT_3128 [Leptolyngbyaceae cyanobacterium JSC-12]
MARSHSVLRRYTPPTCTLEVIAKDSALSRWAAQPVVKNLRFQLSLDDPTLNRDQWIVIRGDRTQLAALCEAVSTYVQQFLVRSHDHLNVTHVEPDASVATLSATANAFQDLSEMSPNLAGITLQPKGLLNHNLYWGSLANAESGAVTSLSTLQLFDLANALDEYSTDVLELPDLGQKGWAAAFPNWAQVAAVVLIAVGLSTSAIRLLDGSGGHIASLAPTTSQGASSSDQKIATQIPPAVVEKATPPVVSNQKLPPPPVSPSPSPQTGTPMVVTPKVTQPSPAAGAISPDAIATYPVPIVPSKPTVITGETSTSPKTNPSAKAPVAVAPSYSRAAADAVSESLSQATTARRGAVPESAAPNTAGSTAFDTIPQVAEVRNYFQQRWKPPEELSQVLEYSLQIAADGSLQGITPLRQASGDYIDRTGMPLVGDEFVSPLKGRQGAKIRLLLEPDGQVRAFLEQ